VQPLDLVRMCQVHSCLEALDIHPLQANLKASKGMQAGQDFGNIHCMDKKDTKVLSRFLLHIQTDDKGQIPSDPHWVALLRREVPSVVRNFPSSLECTRYHRHVPSLPKGKVRPARELPDVKASWMSNLMVCGRGTIRPAEQRFQMGVVWASSLRNICEIPHFF